MKYGRSATINQCVYELFQRLNATNPSRRRRVDDALVDANWVGQRASDPWSGVYAAHRHALEMTCRSRRTISYRRFSVSIDQSPKNLVNFSYRQLKDCGAYRSDVAKLLLLLNSRAALNWTALFIRFSNKLNDRDLLGSQNRRHYGVLAKKSTGFFFLATSSHFKQGLKHTSDARLVVSEFMGMNEHN